MSNNHEEFQTVNSIFEKEVIGGRHFDAVRKVYTADARILPPGADMLTGLDHIASFWEQAVSAMNVTALTLKTVDLQITGDMAIEVGTADLETSLPTSPTVVKYVVVWRKGADGWKWQTDIWNAAAEASKS